jgi:hypothetical protein
VTSPIELTAGETSALLAAAEMTRDKGISDPDLISALAKLEVALTAFPAGELEAVLIAMKDLME